MLGEYSGKIKTNMVNGCSPQLNTDDINTKRSTFDFELISFEQWGDESMKTNKTVESLTGFIIIVKREKFNKIIG